MKTKTLTDIQDDSKTIHLVAEEIFRKSAIRNVKLKDLKNIMVADYMLLVRNIQSDDTLDIFLEAIWSTYAELSYDLSRYADWYVTQRRDIFDTFFGLSV